MSETRTNVLRVEIPTMKSLFIEAYFGDQLLGSLPFVGRVRGSCATGS
jgi:hypothetical protein